mgnify:CR=1 FL=1
MSKFLFDGKNRGGAITGIDITFRNTFKINKPKILDKFLKWMLNRRIAQNDIKSLVITTERKRARKEVLDTKIISE